MDLPTDYTKKFHNEAAEKKARSAWEEQLDRFAAKLNLDRIKAGFAPYSLARIAKLLNNADVHDADTAHQFYRHIETTARNFGKLFDHLTKPKKV